MKIATGLLLTLAPCAAWAMPWQIDSKASTLGFTYTSNGKADSGSFGQFGGKIDFDPAHPEAADIAITVQMASVATSDSQTTDDLKGPDFFNAAKTPLATFTSKKVEKTASGYVAHGQLTLGGVIHPLDLLFTLKVDGKSATADGQTSLSRLAFNIGSGEWKSTTSVADAVTVQVHVVANSK